MPRSPLAAAATYRHTTRSPPTASPRPTPGSCGRRLEQFRLLPSTSANEQSSVRMRRVAPPGRPSVCCAAVRADRFRRFGQANCPLDTELALGRCWVPACWWWLARPSASSPSSTCARPAACSWRSQQSCSWGGRGWPGAGRRVAGPFDAAVARGVDRLVTALGTFFAIALWAEYAPQASGAFSKTGVLVMGGVGLIIGLVAAARHT